MKEGIVPAPSSPGAARRPFPDVDGWYWYRMVEDHDWTIIRMDNWGKLNPHRRRHYSTFQWAGPIPEPSETAPPSGEPPGEPAPNPCPRCEGGGLIINLGGDPDDCPKCGGSGTAPTPVTPKIPNQEPET